jgi:hypothetical protein
MNVDDLRESPADAIPFSGGESKPCVKYKSNQVYTPESEDQAHDFPYIPNGVSTFSLEDSSHLSGRNFIASAPQTSWFLDQHH